MGIESCSFVTTDFSIQQYSTSELDFLRTFEYFPQICMKTQTYTNSEIAEVVLHEKNRSKPHDSLIIPADLA